MVAIVLALYAAADKLFFAAICMDVINTFIEPLSGKGILAALWSMKGREKEHEQIDRDFFHLFWRYAIPITLFGFIGVYQGFFHYSDETTCFWQLLTVTWATLYYWRLPGYNLYMLGAALNRLTMTANHGLMPAMFTDVSDASHCPMTLFSHMKIISDWILVRNWVLSPGDFMIFTGALIFLIYQNFRFFRIVLYRRGSSKPQV
ncbi:DUF5317 family protein [Patescibacteria group bacterium]|nr:DUF5317 family protein [Patescibacteria group bacterium]